MLKFIFDGLRLVASAFRGMNVPVAPAGVRDPEASPVHVVIEMVKAWCAALLLVVAVLYFARAILQVTASADEWTDRNLLLVGSASVLFGLIVAMAWDVAEGLCATVIAAIFGAGVMALYGLEPLRAVLSARGNTAGLAYTAGGACLGAALGAAGQAAIRGQTQDDSNLTGRSGEALLVVALLVTTALLMQWISQRFLPGQIAISGTVLSAFAVLAVLIRRVRDSPGLTWKEWLTGAAPVFAVYTVVTAAFAAAYTARPLMSPTDLIEGLAHGAIAAGAVAGAYLLARALLEWVVPGRARIVVAIGCVVVTWAIVVWIQPFPNLNPTDLRRSAEATGIASLIVLACGFLPHHASRAGLSRI